MRRLALFSALGAGVWWSPHGVLADDPALRREGGRWVQTVEGTETIPAGVGLRVNTYGPVKVTGGAAGGSLGYTVDVSVKTGGEAEARRMLRGYEVRVSRREGWVVVTVPRGPGAAAMTLRVPRGLREAAIATGDGPVQVDAIDCPLRADSGAGPIKIGRAAGDCRLTTGGGEISVGSVEGNLRATTAGGPITARTIRGEATLETGGGDIVADEVGGVVRAGTAGGAVRIGNAGASVVASTGGGPIVVQHARGVVTARNAAGPVQVGAAAGVRCEAATGAIRLNNISGAMRVSTAMGNIMAQLMAGQLAESFLATGNGDITIVIPSNLGVTIRAENEMADSIQRIISDFPGIPVRVQGTQVVAEGAINGGGPLLRISGTGGTIFIKRQQ